MVKKGERILGIDPGSRITGYGIIERQGTVISFVSCGTIRSGTDLPMARRLQQIHEGIISVIREYQPRYGAIEDVFVARNPSSALKLGQARGVLLLALSQHGLEVMEFSAKMVKQSVVGYGQAGKGQIQQAVRALLQLSATPGADAADGLAIAMCCAHHLPYSRLVEKVK